MKNKEIKISKPLYATAKATLCNYLAHLFNIEHQGTELFEYIQGPYIILGNHTNFWDPVLVAHKIPEHVYFVASDEYFRKPVLKHLLRHAGAIPKTKFFSDSETVKNIIKIKKRGGIIGIFPEGRRNWDGTTLEILYPTAKLIKSLKIPVVAAILKGAALAYPRWAKNTRKGKLIIEYKQILTIEEVLSLSVDEIYHVITHAMAHDEYQWQQKHMIQFKGSALAERLELFLFTCPHCHQIGSMRSEEHRFFCRECGYTTHYNVYGFFESESEDLYFTNTRDWNLWQLSELEKRISSIKDFQPIISDQQANLFKGQRLSPLQKYQSGHIALFHDRLEFTNYSGEKLQFLLNKIYGLNIQQNDKFEFYHEKTLFRFSFEPKYVSAYKWAQTITLLQQITN